MHEAWNERIRERAGRIGIVGHGYVGLPLGLVFCEVGFPVVGFDLGSAKVRAVAGGESFIKHIGPERVAAAVATGHHRLQLMDPIGREPQVGRPTR